ncbi:MAG: hypothetical protein ACHQ06_02750 [Candidatus Dormibacteria bacterium]|jgi:hypothetical protein
MSNDSFLVIAETRADHLRQLSQHERALEWVSAALSEVESEIPDLELAMAVYRRLNPNAGDQGGPSQPAFLGIAGVRADHLRQLSHHMRSLNWVHAPLSEIEAEIPDLEKAMSVYRRLIPEEASLGLSGTRSTTAPPSSPPEATSSRGRSGGSRGSRDAEDSGDPPSFKEYALQHLDSVAVETGEEGDGSPANGANANR